MQHITSNPISSTYISLGQNMVSMAHFSSISQSCPTIWNPIDCSTSGFSVHHRLLELSQIHVDQVGDVIQQSSSAVPLSSWPQSYPASGSFLMNQFFTSGGQSIGASASNEYSGLISFRID